MGPDLPGARSQSAVRLRTTACSCQLITLPAGSPIRRILLAERPDVVEICDRYTLPYLGGLLRIGWLAGDGFHPAVVSLSCERLDDTVAAYLGRAGIGKTVSRSYMRWIYFPQADHHVTVSSYVSEEPSEASGEGHKVRRGVWVSPMGVDVDRFSPARRTREDREALAGLAGGDGRSVILLYAGRLAPEKNLELLLATVRRLIAGGGYDFRLLIAGWGTLGGRLRKECAASLPDRVTFLGHRRGRNVLAGIYANCDAFIHPNPREPFGIALLEAMASGLPLVAPSSGGVTSYATHENAWLTDPTPEAFEAAVRRMLADPEARARKVEAARLTAEEHCWPNAAGRYLGAVRRNPRPLQRRLPGKV